MWMTWLFLRESFATKGVWPLAELSTVTEALVGVDEMPTSCDVPCMIDAQADKASEETIAATRVVRFMELRSEEVAYSIIECREDRVDL
jgi:hypothetical protein